MANIPAHWDIEDFIDAEAKNYYNSILKQRGKGADMIDVL